LLPDVMDIPSHDAVMACESSTVEQQLMTEMGDIDRIEGLNMSPTKSMSGALMMDTTATGDGSQDASVSALDSGDNLPPDADTAVRARVFALADDGTWEDITTGAFVMENDHVPKLDMAYLSK